MTTTSIVTLAVNHDNYAYAVIKGNDACIIDASEAEPVKSFLEQHRLALGMILSTHHHGDHTGGNRALKKQTGCVVVGGDRRIAGIDRIVTDRQHITDGPFSFECIAVPGHTKGCRAYYLQESGALFTGDTLFYAGCGRLFEGTAAEMHDSLSKISALPPDTGIYCGHEYTLNNLEFALSVEPNNSAVTRRSAEVRRLRDKGEPSGPAPLSMEFETNPFLRTDQTAIRATLHCAEASAEAVFAELRRRKDRF
jgi:hydroxyacylglutathione hydrolase